MMDQDLLRSFVQGADTETSVVDGVARELWRHFQLGEGYSWLAVKAQIEEAEAQRYPGRSKGEVAQLWLQAAQEGRLVLRHDPTRGIIIREV